MNTLTKSEDTQENSHSHEPQPCQQKEERWGTNKDKTNATYEITDAQTKRTLP